jgi:hypothetical protein
MRAWGTKAFTAAGAVVAALLYVLYRYDPSTVSFYPPCVFRAVTGLLCPGCGATRAVHHLLHGDVAGAFRLNAMLLLVGPVLAIAVATRPTLIGRPWFGWSVAVLIIGWGVFRNVFGV